MSHFTELKKEAEKLGLKVPIGTSTLTLEKLIAEAKEPKLKPALPPADDPEDTGERLKPPAIKERNGDEGSSDRPKGVEKGDYLWPYEVDRNTKQPHFKAKNIPFNPPWEYRQPQRGRALIQKARLLAEPTEIYMIPRPDTEQGETCQTININSYHLELPKNVRLKLPESVVATLVDSYTKTQEAINTGLFENARGTRYS